MVGLWQKSKSSGNNIGISPPQELSTSWLTSWSGYKPSWPSIRADIVGSFLPILEPQQSCLDTLNSPVNSFVVILSHVMSYNDILFKFPVTPCTPLNLGKEITTRPIVVNWMKPSSTVKNYEKTLKNWKIENNKTWIILLSHFYSFRLSILFLHALYDTSYRACL